MVHRRRAVHRGRVVHELVFYKMG